MACLAGCAGTPTANAIVFFCDGAGWYAGASPVRSGLRDAGFRGEFETFRWSSMLGPGTDHLISARSKAVARRLSKRLAEFRKANPRATIHLMGLSAGTAVVLNAVKQLPPGVRVNNIVLLSSSVSSRHDLISVMRRANGFLYNTVSKSDSILRSLAVNADGEDGPPAGRVGFRPTRRSAQSEAYHRVVNLPWRPAYLAYDWDGGHVGVTDSNFIRTVIAPRLMSREIFPLDRPIGGFSASN
ncbi:MAG TPA: hypothetical protein VNT79_05390 [Phycisphaerae bacterium]|nr:hypothetical protein [Phycisphaerae bacterium]